MEDWWGSQKGAGPRVRAPGSRGRSHTSVGCLGAGCSLGAAEQRFPLDGELGGGGVVPVGGQLGPGEAPEERELRRRRGET